MTEESVIIDLQNLKSKDSNQKWEAVNNLKSFLKSNPSDYRSKLIVKSFLILVKDSDDRIRETTFSTLITILTDFKQVEDLVINGFNDANPGVRALALEWMNVNKYPKLTDFTIRSLKDPKEVVQKIALDIVASQEIHGIENILTNMLQTSINASTGLRRSIIYALGKLKTEQAIGLLLEIMQNKNYDDWTRNQASSALEHMGGSELIIPFLKNLIDPNEYVRETAASYLSKNKENIVPIIRRSRQIEFLAFLKFGSENTKKDFSDNLHILLIDLEPELKEFHKKLLEKEKFTFKEISSQLNTSELAVKILINEILEIPLLELKDGSLMTETGLIKLITSLINEKRSLYFPELIKKDPFKGIQSENIKAISNKIDSIQWSSPNFIVHKTELEEIYNTLQTSGILSLKEIAKMLNQPVERIKIELIDEFKEEIQGWYNSLGEFFTIDYLTRIINEKISKDKILAVPVLLKSLGNPKVDTEKIKEIIKHTHEGKWLDDIQVFIDISEFNNLIENASRLDEGIVQHLLKHIDLNFSIFLNSLKKIVTIKTFKTKDGKLISLESLYQPIQERIIGKGYLSILTLLNESKLDKSLQNEILDYISNEFSGRFNIDKTYFFSEELILKVEEEVKLFSRLNFDIIAYKLDLPKIIVEIIIQQILVIKGFVNKTGEFITSKGIKEEINRILEYKGEIPLGELFEVLEISEDEKHQETVRNLILSEKKFIQGANQQIFFTQKRAMNIVLFFLKKPETRTKELIEWAELINLTNLPKEILKQILESLVSNQLIPGVLDKKGYRP